jgi:hypothetical protein
LISLLCITSIQSIAILLNCSLLSTETLLTYVPDKILNKKLTLHSLLVLEFASDKHLVAYSLNRSISEWGQNREGIY